MRALAVATFNVHCGVDGWGRPYDLVSACRLLDADVLVLQESWTPRKGPGTAQRLAEALGYDVVARPFSPGWLLQPSPDAPARSSWGPKPWARARALRALKRRARIERADMTPLPDDPGGPDRAGVPPATTSDALGDSQAPPTFQRGTWDLSVLTRIPVVAVDVIELGKLRIDPVEREAIVLTLHERGLTRGPVTVVGTHMSHLTDGSPLQYRRLARSLPVDDVIVLGDMNMPGLPLRAMLPAYRPVVRGRTWPAWRPVIQTDHVLATPGLAARAEGEVVTAARGSDHLPARARFVLD